MINKKQIKTGAIFILGILLILSFVSSYMETNFNSFGSGMESSYWSFDSEMCEAGNDLVLQIAPFGCTPAVVRSDLLEEQSVPVFCQVAATEINPLIDIEAIDSVTFSGQYPREVSGIGFHPAKSALGVQGDLNSPILNNIGYVVIVLKQQETEKDMPDYVEGNLTARVRYDIENAFGIGKASFYLPEMTDGEFANNANQYSFWEGKGYLRAESVGSDSAVIAIYDYDDADFERVASVELQKGETSRKISIPTIDNCLAEMELRLDSFENPDTRAKLNINGDIVEVGEKEWFLENRCQVIEIKKQGISQKVKIKCKEDSTSDSFSKTSTFNLMISPRVNLTICNGTAKDSPTCQIKEYSLGDYLFETADADKKSVYLGYIDYRKDGRNEELYVVLLAKTEKSEKLTEDEIDSMSLQAKLSISDKQGIPLISVVSNSLEKIIGTGIRIGKRLVEGKNIKILSSSQGEKEILTRHIKINGFSQPGDFDLGDEIFFDASKCEVGTEITIKLEENYKFKKNAEDKWEYEGTILTNSEVDKFYTEGKIEDYDDSCILSIDTSSIKQNYDASIKDYDVLIDSFFNENYGDLGYGEQAYFEKINLALEMGQMKTASELCVKFEQRYPDSRLFNNLKSKCGEAYMFSSSSISSRDVSINGVIKSISFEGIYEPSEEDYRASIRIQGPNGNIKTITLTKDQTVYLNDFRGEGGIFEVNIKNEVLYFMFENGEWYYSINEGENVKKIKDWDIGLYTDFDPLAIDLKNEKDFSGGKKVLEKYNVAEMGTNEFVQLVDLEDNYAVLNVNLRPSGKLDALNKFITSSNSKLEKDKTESFGSGYVFSLIDVHLEKSAKVTIIPSIDNTGTEANFSFKIGIEKRDIHLSPEKTREKIENLNKTIKEWEDISENLGNVVKGLKTSCLGVGAFLTVKNFFANTGGKAIARQKIMRGENSWYERCTDAISGKGDLGAKGYKTINECLTKESDAIDKAVDDYYKIIEAKNAEYKNLQEGLTEKTWLGEVHVNDDELAKKVFTAERKKKLISNLEKNYGETIKIDNKEVPISKVVEMINKDSYSITSFRNLEVLAESSGVDSLKTMANSGIEKELQGIYANEQQKAEAKILADSMEVPIEAIVEFESKDTITKTITNPPRLSDYSKKSQIEKCEGCYYAIIPKGNTRYLVTYGADGVKRVTYEADSSGNWVKSPSKDLDNLNLKIYTGDSYKNPYKSSSSDPEANMPILSYYETEPYAGLPAIVPFDCTNGWYVSVQQVTGAFGSLRSYDDSGVATNYYICNVGKNNKEENRGGEDDECRMINKGTGQPYDAFGYLSTSEASKLVRDADNAIQTASRNYKDWKFGRIVSLGNCGKVKVGKPAVDIPDMQCQDFMSPKDCQLLFNVCDPVICPSSRCNFGGSYYVKDVIQSGIIGSIALCAPNIREGIYIPICLTGVKAGIDGLLSVFHSYRDCLQESLDTGKMVGICDEIYSIHLCEFFWRQSLPLAKIIIPKIMEIAMGQNTRGGGEYLGVASAWQNAEKSIDYFAQYYAQDSYESFKARITEGVGDAICQNSISASYPDGGSVLDSLTDLDSPPQFHGRFDEIEFTTATNPPISHYKVSYHIYAGKESRAYYEVYLMGDDSSTFYQDASLKRYVASGYIATGDYASETLDFTAPAGYKQMCINVNGQEECGFQEVSTSFAVNYVESQYLAEQASQTDIDSEKECISGSASVYSLLNPNLQSAAENLIDPQIYNQGIIRICASINPGIGTDAKAGTNESRWVQVGYCDKENDIKCWQDEESVKKVIKDLDTLTEVLSAQSNNTLEILIKEGNYESRENIEEKIKEKETLMEKGDYEGVINLVNEYLDKTLWNEQKARLIHNRAKAYGELAKKLYRSIVQEKTFAEEESSSSSSSSGGESSVSGGCKSYPCSSSSAGRQYVMGGDECWKVVGKKVIELANNFKDDKLKEDSAKYSYLTDENVKKELGVSSFGCLVAMVARQEGCLAHCKYDASETNPLYCDGTEDNVITGDNENAMGIMQITKSNHGEHYGFEDNIEKGAGLLIDSYSVNTKTYSCIDVNENYKGWNRSIRTYNGWGCSSLVKDYVNNVLKWKNEIIRLFPECEIQKTYEVSEVGFFAKGKDYYEDEFTDDEVIYIKIEHDCDSVKFEIKEEEDNKVIKSGEIKSGESSYEIGSLNVGNYFVDKIDCMKGNSVERTYSNSGMNKKIQVVKSAIEMGAGSKG
jgi:hypothetical protein